MWPRDGYTMLGLHDPFGNAPVYRRHADGKGFDLVLLGADGAEGGTGSDEDLVYKK